MQFKITCFHSALNDKSQILLLFSPSKKLFDSTGDLFENLL